VSEAKKQPQTTAMMTNE